jgi:hypothetical protein
MQDAPATADVCLLRPADAGARDRREHRNFQRCQSSRPEPAAVGGSSLDVRTGRVIGVPRRRASGRARFDQPASVLRRAPSREPWSPAKTNAFAFTSRRRRSVEQRGSPCFRVESSRGLPAPQRYVRTTLVYRIGRLAPGGRTPLGRVSNTMVPLTFTDSIGPEFETT